MCPEAGLFLPGKFPSCAPLSYPPSILAFSDVNLMKHVPLMINNNWTFKHLVANSDDFPSLRRA